MDPVWVNLPTDLVRRVLSLADLPIDTRLYFKLENKKLNLKKFLKSFRNEIVYDRSNHILWDFRSMANTEIQFFLKRKNFKLICFRSPDAYVFNMGWDPYEFTMHAGEQTIGPTMLTNHIVIRDKIKFIN